MILEDEQTQINTSNARSNYKRSLYVSVILLIAAICCGWIKQERAFKILETNIDLRDVFAKLDVNNDGSLTFTEFLGVLNYDLSAFKTKNEPETLDYEVHKPSEIILIPEEEILTIQAKLKPLVISSLTKDVTDELLNKHGTTAFKGIFDWKKPEKKLCNFAAHHFSAFLPPEEVDLKPGTIWWIVPSSLGKRESPLSSERYQSPKLSPEHNYLYMLLSMLHKHPFLLSRFAPQGTIAIIRAVSEHLLDIVFRLHAEFQLNEPPNFPFWFTPSQFRGRIVANKNGSSILYFHMEVPSEKSLNVDMEWLNGPKQSDGMEVDIGYIPQLSLTSTGPSVQLEGIVNVNSTFLEALPNYENMISSLKWSQELKIEEAHSILEKTIYPFKQKISPQSVASQFAKNCLEYYSFPVESLIASPNGTVLHHINANALLDIETDDEMFSVFEGFIDPLEKKYVAFLKQGIAKQLSLNENEL